MTSWPILERELRVLARRKVTYWGRFSVAAAAILVCVPPLLWQDSFAGAGRPGANLFNGLASLAFVLSAMACLSTADSLSAERREGTLGLLLLTRVKHLDLLLGKLASSGLASILGLVAFGPLMALPMLSGGVSGSEIVRTFLVLLDTVFLSLSIGLWVSARGSERFRTAMVAVLILAGVVLGPPLLEWIFPKLRLGVASPLSAMFLAGHVPYRTTPGRYWLSLGLLQCISWVFLFGSVWELGRTVAQGGDCAPASGKTIEKSSAEGEVRPGFCQDSGSLDKIPCAYCGRQNQVDAVFCYECGTELRPKPATRKDSWTLSTAPTPLHWLLGRQRSLKPLIWIAAGVSFAELLFYGVLGRVAALGFFSPSLVPVFNLAEAVVQGTLLAWVASRFLVQARQTGELELLMTTPLGATTLVTTQWEMLKRQARAPALLAIVVYGISPFSSAFVPGMFWRLPYLVWAVLHAVNTLLGVAAVFWLALLFGLLLTRQSQVIFWTVLLAKGLPYSAGMAWSIVFRLVVSSVIPQRTPWSPAYWILAFLVPSVLVMALYLFLIRGARARVLGPAAIQPLNPGQFLSKAADLVRAVRSWKAT